MVGIRSGHIGKSAVVSWIFAALLQIATPPAFAQEVHRFRIASQDAVSAIHEFGHQSGVQILASGEDLRGKRLNTLNGEWSTDEALKQLLAGTGIGHRYVGARAVALVMAHGDTSAAELKLVTAKDANPAAAAATQEDRRAGAASDENRTDDTREIVVTGTNIRGIAPASAPVVSFDKETIRDSGVPTLTQFVRRIPQNFGGGVGEENRGDGSSSAGGSGVNLRGFGNQRTLTLLNGRRIAASGSTGDNIDISIIPLSAVERIDVITAGASSIYGSDAVGGVINFVLRDSFDGAETQMSGGTLTQGGGSLFNFDQIVGRSWAGGNAFVTYDYFKQDALKAGERDFPAASMADTDLIPDVKRHSVLGTFRQKLGAGIEVFGDGFFVDTQHHRESEFGFSGFGGRIINEDVDGRDYGMTLGARRALGATWQAELLGTYSKTDRSTDSKYADDGTTTGSSGGDGYDDLSRSAVLEAKVDGDLFRHAGGAVKAAVGVQGRFERFHTTRLGNTVTRQQREVKAAYAEVLAPIVGAGNRRTGIERLQLSLSGRYEEFGKGVDNIDPQVGVVWGVTDQVSLRGNWGTSFRAPSLSEYGFRDFATTFGFFTVPNPVSSAPQTLVLQGFNTKTGVETSTTRTVGLDFTPRAMAGLKFQLTWFDIELNDEISRPALAVNLADPVIAPFVILRPSQQQIIDAIGSTKSTLAEVQATLAAAGRSLSDVEAIYDFRVTNIALRRTAGVDLTTQYQRETAHGNFGLSFSSTYLTDFSYQSSSTQPVLDRLNQPFQPLRWKFRAGLAWSQGPLSANVFTDYANDYTDKRTAVTVPVSSLTTVDLSLAYRFDAQARGLLLPNLRVALNVQNLFDKDPPYVGSASSNYLGSQGYDSYNASARGRYVGVSITKPW